MDLSVISRASPQHPTHGKCTRCMPAGTGGELSGYPTGPEGNVTVNGITMVRHAGDLDDAYALGVIRPAWCTSTRLISTVSEAFLDGMDPDRHRGTARRCLA